MQNNPPPPPPPQFNNEIVSKKDNMIIRIGSIVFFVSTLLFIPSIPVALMAPLIFDAPGSGKCIYTVVTFWCSIFYPIAYVIFSILYFKLKKRGKYELALAFGLIPLIIFLIGATMMIINGGQFVC